MKRDNIDLFGFVDESGTAGAQINKNDGYLILSLVIFRDEKEMKTVHEKYTELRRSLGRKDDYEFHYTHNKQKVRDMVFDVIRDIDFEFMTFVVKKDSVKTHASYVTLAKMLINRLQKENENENIKIIIDTNPVLLKNLNKIKKARIIKNMRFQQSDSAAVDCLQLVDYVVGAHGKIIKNESENNFNKIRKKLRLLQIYNYD